MGFSPSSRLVWDKRAQNINAYVRFLSTFTISSPPPSATLAISADSNYCVWINGQPAGFGQYADFPHYKVYDELEVSRFLRPGNNTIALLCYHLGEDCSVYTIGDPGAVFTLYSGDRIIAFSSEETQACPAPEYLQGEIERFSPQLSFGFRYDATVYDGWHEDGYVPGPGWQNAAVFDRPDPLISRPIKKLVMQAPSSVSIAAQGSFTDIIPIEDNPGRRMQTAALSHIPAAEIFGNTSVRQTLPRPEGLSLSVDRGDGIYVVLDLGQEEAGLLNLDLEVGRDVLIDIGFGEHLEDLRVRSHIGKRTFAVTYLGRGGRERFTYYLKRLGCRYIQLHIRSRKATLYYAGLIPMVYPLERQGAFQPSDRLHAKIYETALHTLTLCMHEHYEDCPWREQALYAMDARNQMLCGYYAFGEYRFARASLLLLTKGQREDGLLELCAPAKVGVNIPCFSLIWIVALHEYCLYSGDLDFGKEMLPIADRILSVFASFKGDEGLIKYPDGYWNFYEWSDGLDGDTHKVNGPITLTQDAPINCFYSLALSAMEKLCRNIGKRRAASLYAAEVKSVNLALDKIFWNPQKSLYASYILAGRHSHYAELTQSLMVCCGACTGKKQTLVLSALANPSNGMVPITLSHSIFKYDALLTDPKRYGRFVFDDVADKWGHMLFSGATSFWETESCAHAFNQAGSLCHGWSAVPVYLYHAYILGIRPQKPGFIKYTISPVPSGILSAKALMLTPDRQRRLFMAYDNGKPYVKFI